MVARMQKMKAGNLGGAYKHNERIFETHSNKDIDPSRVAPQLWVDGSWPLGVVWTAN